MGRGLNYKTKVYVRQEDVLAAGLNAKEMLSEDQKYSDF
jgi:hypothetical protein